MMSMDMFEECRAHALACWKSAISDTSKQYLTWAQLLCWCLFYVGFFHSRFYKQYWRGIKNVIKSNGLSYRRLQLHWKWQVLNYKKKGIPSCKLGSHSSRYCGISTSNQMPWQPWPVGCWSLDLPTSCNIPKCRLLRMCDPLLYAISHIVYIDSYQISASSCKEGNMDFNSSSENKPWRGKSQPKFSCFELQSSSYFWSLE